MSRDFTRDEEAADDYRLGQLVAAQDLALETARWNGQQIEECEIHGLWDASKGGWNSGCPECDIADVAARAARRERFDKPNYPIKQGDNHAA